MRLAIVSDIHADRPALEAALALAESLGADEVVCAGDLLDYGLHPEETIAILREKKIRSIRGNHDRWALGEASSERTRKMLSPESVEWLAALPPAFDLDESGVRVAIRHGTPTSDMRGIWPRFSSPEDMRAHMKRAACDVLVVGHTHVPFRCSVGGAPILNPGALLREPSPRLAAKNLLFDPESRRLVPGPRHGAGGTLGILELPSRRYVVHRVSDGVAISIPDLAY